MPLHTPDTLLAALHDGACYPHPTHNIRAIHTHISTIFLTDEFAYKIKKPVNFGFLDFTHLADRKHFCEEELRLNRRLAPQLYLAVVPIVYHNNGHYHVATHANYHPKTDETIVEYAVKMQQFNPNQQLDHLLTQQQLPIEIMDALAAKIADFHCRIASAQDDDIWGSPTTVMQPMQHNFVHLRTCFQALPPPLSSTQRLERLSLLENWTQQEYTRLHSTLLARKQGGYIRACHGDMHVGNIALLDKEITIFDGIEFNDALRWIDTASEIAFLVMDLEDRHANAYAHRFLNQYLSLTGDYDSLAVLNFYKVYRALVRAKVNALRLAQLPTQSLEQFATLQDCDNYLQLAQQYTQPTTPALVITHGLSGSGKSFGCRQLVEQLGWIQIRSDVERKRLAHQQQLDTSQLYAQTLTLQTYTHLATLAQRITRHGYTVVVDATFLDRTQRDTFQQLATNLQLPFLILSFVGTTEQLVENIQRRLLANNDVSDADVKILHQQLQHYRPLQMDEPCITIPCYTLPPITAIQTALNKK